MSRASTSSDDLFASAQGDELTVQDGMLLPTLFMRMH